MALMPDDQLSLGSSLSLKDYLDAQIAEVRRAVEVAKDVPPPEAVPLREHIEAVLNEQRRAISTAEEEREKSAKALRGELARAIEEGDKNLREHISQQILQIRAALESAEKLEIHRFDSVAAQIEMAQSVAEQHVSQLRRERELVTGAQQDAIAKAEVATGKQFESVNEWRAQSLDRERSMQEQTGRLTSSFMPREVAEAQFADLRRAIAEINEKMSKVV